MSTTHNQTVKFWEDLECKLLAGTRISSISDKDFRTLLQGLLINAMVLEESLAPFLPKIRSLLVPCITSIVLQNEWKTVATEFKSLLMLILNNQDERSIIELLSDFKHHSQMQDAGIILSPLVRITSFCSTTNDVGVAGTIQFLSGCSRITLESYNYEEKCLADYLANEARLDSFDHNPLLVRALNAILKEWITEYPIPDLELKNFKFGPGASASLGRASIVDKYDDLCTDSLLNYCFREYDVHDYTSGLRRTCEVVFVPKSSLTWRTISMEPASLMYAQQACFSALSEWFKNHPRLKKIIHLSDASLNREAAKMGSTHINSLCTIDLSSASDSVSWDLIKGVFRGTKLMRWAYGTRSTHAMLPDRTVIPLRKFAPMGSALCFPVECLVFALICELAQRMCHPPGKSKYLVYGDDIVIPQSMWNITVDFLQLTGFTVNEDKSFSSYRNHFRESCGGEFWYGFDVTPFRLPRNFTFISRESLLVSTSLFASTISLINSLAFRGLKTPRSFLIKKMMKLPRHLRPLFGPFCPGIQDYSYIVSDNPTNFHLIVKSETDIEGKPYYGGMLATHGVLVDQKDDYHLRDHNHDFIEIVKLHEWYRNAEGREKVIEPLSIQVCRTSVALTTSQTVIGT